MVADKVAKELRSALETMKAERDDLNEKIGMMEQMISKLGVKRGPGRPPGSGTKKRRGRPPGSKNKTTKRGPGRPPGSGKKKATSKKTASKKTGEKKTRNWSPAARKAAAERMKKIWADRKKTK